MTKATQITSVAELKRRLAVGVRVTLVDHSVTDRQGNITYPRHKYMGVPRMVAVTNSVGVGYVPVEQPGAMPSWQDWPKKAELITSADDPDVFTVDKGWVSCTYRIES